MTKKFLTKKEYLASRGITDESHPKLKAEGSREYKRAYYRHYRRQKRAQNRRCNITLTPKEYFYLKSEATDHNSHLSRFLKSAALAYSKDHYLVPDEIRIQKMESLLRGAYSLIMKIANDPNSDYTKRFIILANTIAQLEDKLTETLRHPPKIINY